MSQGAASAGLAGDTATTEFVAYALLVAIWRRTASDTLRRHSDQGDQQTSSDVQRLLVDLGITRSTSRPGDVWDSSLMKSVFVTLKT